MKKLFCTAVFAVIGFLAFAQERIAVFPFEDMGNIFTHDESLVFYREFSNEFATSSAEFLSVIPRQDIERLININAAFIISDFSASTKTAEMQRILNDTQILTGLLGRAGSNIRITVSLYTYPEMLQVLGGVTLTVADKAELFGKIPELVMGMQNMIARARPPESTAVSDGTYRVGDRGPAGGYIFYDKGVFSNGWRYMEAALTDVTAQWGTYEHNVAGTDVALGSGKRNTQLIVDNLNRIGERYRAAQICASLDINGFTDWFLPSKEELDMMFKNLKQKELGSFTNNWYWSSSQYENYNGAWVQHFSLGNQYGVSKNNTNSIRAVRSF